MRFLSILLVILISFGFSQNVRWLYTYNRSQADSAKAIVQDINGNLYVAGSDGDFLVISLTPEGEERWVYRYNGSANGYDCAHSIIYGLDGNLYVAGYVTNINRGKDMLVVSLTPEGEERWVFVYEEHPYDDVALSIAQNVTGGLCAVGYVKEGEIYWAWDIELTSEGELRGEGGAGGENPSAMNKVVPGNNYFYYVTGYADMAFVIFRVGGGGILVKVFESEYGDASYFPLFRPDGLIYIAGSLREDFTVLCCTTDTFLREKWQYHYNGPGNGDDDAYAIAYGFDNNLYACGKIIASNLNSDLTVISLTPDGEERWVYRYNGSADSEDVGYALIYGNDGNIYVAGLSTNENTGADLTVIKLTPEGEERWVYRYNGSANGYDCAHSIIYGLDNNLYLSGLVTNNETGTDIIVISLLPQVEIKERFISEDLKINNFNLSQLANVTIYNPLGKRVLPHNLNSGIYFLKIKKGKETIIKKVSILK